MRFNNLLNIASEQVGDKTFVITPKQSTTYSELYSKSQRLAAALIDAGVNPNDRVVIVLDNSIETIVSIFAVWYAGATISLVNPTTKHNKLEFIFNNCTPKCVITHQKFLKEVEPALAEAPSVIRAYVHQLKNPSDLLKDFDEAIDQAPAANAIYRGISSDLAMIIYTSGSTGFPKGVMMTHDNIQAAATSVSSYIGMNSDDITLNCLPLSFDYGLYQVFMTLLRQGSLVLENSFAFPAAVLKRIREENVTGFPLVPTVAAMLLQMKDINPDDYQTLRFITNTAAALPPTHIQRLQKLFPSAKLFSMYGLTESKRCTYLPPEELERRPGSVGKAIPNTEVYIVDDNNQRVGPNVIGELVVRGSHVMQGYWNNTEATEKRLKTGENYWEKVLHTGDLFKSDEEGFLYFVGRVDDIIKSRGEKIAPKELETILLAMDGVAEVAVIGVPDDIFGSAIKAFIVPAEGEEITDKQVLRYATGLVENYMVPKHIEICSSLPKTSNGKIDKKQLS